MRSSSHQPAVTARPARAHYRVSLQPIARWLLPLLVILACAPGPTPHPPAARVGEGGPLRDARAAVFERNGCDGCHSVVALGVRARDSTVSAPDLSLAGARVPALYGMSLARFLEEPTGTMAVVLDLEIRLSAVDRDSIVATLDSLARKQPR